jgi:hypothetical protein
MADVIAFPGGTTLDIPPERVLQSAPPMAAVMVIGTTEDGSLYVASSKGDVAWAHWMLNNAVAWLCDQERAAKGW